MCFTTPLVLPSAIRRGDDEAEARKAEPFALAGALLKAYTTEEPLLHESLDEQQHGTSFANCLSVKPLSLKDCLGRDEMSESH